MGRKPYKRVLLTDSEFKVVNKMAHWTRVDESWFYLNDSDDGTTAVWDMEKNYWVSLQFGLKLLRESFGRPESEDFVHLGVLTKKEYNVWQKLVERIK